MRKDKAAMERRLPGSALSRMARLRERIGQIRQQVTQVLSLLFLIGLVLSSVALFVWFFFFTDVFKVQAVTVVDARRQVMTKAKQIIEEEVQNVPLGKNMFFVDTEFLEAEIESQLPSVKTVHIVRKLPGTIKVIIQEKNPVLLLLSGGHYYFVDRQGAAYEEATLDSLPGVVLPTVKNDDRGALVTLGVRAIDESFVSFIMTIQKELPDKIGANVMEIHMPSLAAREVHVLLDNNWVIMFDTTRQAQAQIEVLKNVLSSKLSQEEVEGLEYVDLRVPKRIYYKTRYGES